MINSQDNNSNKNFNTHAQKKYTTGIIRWSAVVPIIILTVLGSIYFKIFFDSHVKSALEWLGYQIVGAEVNIQSFKSSITEGSVELTKIEITSSEKPDFNAFEIDQIRFNLNGDALFRLKFVIDEMAAETIQIMSKRKYRGRVKPPEPPSNKPSLVSELQEKALNKVETQNKNNLIGDLALFLKTGDYKSQLNEIDSQLKSKKLALELQSKWDSKQKDWDKTFKDLQTESDIKKLKTDFESIKYKDFKSPQELEASVKKFNEVKTQVEEKVKLATDAQKMFNDDLKQIKEDSKKLELQVTQDIETLKNHLKIPKIDPKQLAQSLFMDYLSPYLSKLDKINQLAEKYLPPKYSQMVSEKLDPKKLLQRKNKSSEDLAKEDESIQPHPRARGMTYEFPIKNGYPLFWIKKISVSSKSNAQNDAGDISGTITDIVSNQKQIGKQTELSMSGHFNTLKLSGIKLKAYFNNLQQQPSFGLNFNIQSFPLSKIDFIKSNEGSIELPASLASLESEISTVGFKKYNLNFKNQFNNTKFITSSKEPIVDELLKSTFAQITNFDLNASAYGELNQLQINLNSSLGEKLEIALSASFQKKIDEINIQIKEKMNSEINKIKQQIDDQINKLSGGYLKNANNLQSQLDSQKNLIDEKVKVAKKDLENKAKNKLEEEGKKAIDDLKKKFGF